jgi:hypothetical protein
MRQVKENGKIPTWCSQVCKNSMTDICFESCWPEGDTSHFVMKEGLNIDDLPSFPWREFTTEMTVKDRQTAIAVYTAILVDHVKGIRVERNYRPFPKGIQNSRSSQVFESIKDASLRADSQE